MCPATAAYAEARTHVRACGRGIKEAGIRWKVVGVEIGGKKLGSYIDGTMIDFFPIYANDQRVGNVTSACHSPRLEKNIGYAMLPIEFAELGTELAVETPDERTSAVVVRKPFIDPEKEVPKQHLAATAKDN
jgi:glycine cleavage system aminomethyltransferase T